MTMRTVFLVDGFNVYHSAVDIERDCGLKVKWLDYVSLFNSYLHHLGKDATLQSIYYFTALAYHLGDPKVVSRHETYIRCLRETGVKDQQGRFKAKSPIKCPHCGNQIIRHEEKETDVAIVSKMFEVLLNDECDCVVLVTGDTDLAPAVKTAKRLFPHKQIVFAFPYRRKNDELAQIAPKSFKMGRGNYALHQLPDPFPLSDGTKVAKPTSW
ncbi:MAG: NYN domain-containing protein [Anaerolineae bacterium]